MNKAQWLKCLKAVRVRIAAKHWGLRRQRGHSLFHHLPQQSLCSLHSSSGSSFSLNSVTQSAEGYSAVSCCVSRCRSISGLIRRLKTTLWQRTLTASPKSFLWTHSFLPNENRNWTSVVDNWETVHHIPLRSSVPTVDPQKHWARHETLFCIECTVHMLPMMLLWVPTRPVFPTQAN